MKPQLDLSAFGKFPELKTRRLTLRQLNLRDAGEVFYMRSNPRVNKHVLRPEMSSAKDARSLLQSVRDGYSQKSMLAFAGLLREQSTLIGTCGLFKIDPHNLRAEVGGELFPEYWGKGIALEAFTTVIEYGFRGLNLHSIEARVNPANRGALALLKALNFEKEAHLKDFGWFEGQFHDLTIHTKFNPDHL